MIGKNQNILKKIVTLLELLNRSNTLYKNVKNDNLDLSK